MPYIRPNISLIGPPGSGKGSYGKLLAESIPLIVTSTLLKQAQLDVSSGKLLDDETVSSALAENLPQPPYFLDGFPRSMNQVRLMERDWPKPMHVRVAIALDVPREVCFQKLMGRRHCDICNRPWNLADVKHERFVMPPNLPKPTECNNRCSGEKDWTQRPDDKPEIIQERLDIFYETTEPILEHYDSKGMLFRFSPHKGFDDVPRFKASLDKFLESIVADK